MGRPIKPYLDQVHYRWMDDDGDVDANTPLAGPDTAISDITKGTVLRLRVQVDQSEPTATSDAEVEACVQYATSTAGPWTNVPIPAELVDQAFVMYDSTLASECTLTTTALCGTPAFTWVDGHYYDVSNPDATTVILPMTGGTTEWEMCMQVTDYAAVGQTYYFRLLDYDAEFNAYTIYPQLTTLLVATLTWTRYGSVLQYDPTQYSPSPASYFEVELKYGGGANAAYARLFNVTDGVVVDGSEVSTTSTTWVRLRVGPLSLPTAAKEYAAEIGAYTGEEASCRAARLVLRQSVA